MIWKSHLVTDERSVESASAFARMQCAFEQAAAAAAGGVREARYGFAGVPVRLRIAGRTLAERLAAPFTHLRRGEAAPKRSLTIDLWDGTDTGIPCPPGAAQLPNGPTWSVDGGVLATSPDGRFVAFQLQRALTWLDRAAQHIVGWTASAEHLSLYERAKPFPALLSVWYSDRGVQVMHAALISHDGHGILFPGNSGTGKSTCAAACVSAGMHYLGDDFVGLQTANDGFLGHSLYSSTRLAPEHSMRFPSLFPHAIPARPPAEPKSLIFLSDVFPERLDCSAPIRVVAFPIVTDRPRARIRRAAKGEALLRLVPSSIFSMVPSPGARGVERLAQLVGRVPTYWLELGRDLDEIPQRVEELVATAMGS